jgi:hypothetical protein
LDGCLGIELRKGGITLVEGLCDSGGGITLTEGVRDWGKQAMPLYTRPWHLSLNWGPSWKTLVRVAE